MKNLITTSLLIALTFLSKSSLADVPSCDTSTQKDKMIMLLEKGIQENLDAKLKELGTSAKDGLPAIVLQTIPEMETSSSETTMYAEVKFTLANGVPVSLKIPSFTVELRSTIKYDKFGSISYMSCEMADPVVDDFASLVNATDNYSFSNLPVKGAPGSPEMTVFIFRQPSN
jgi:hypothetical protein